MRRSGLGRLLAMAAIAMLLFFGLLLWMLPSGGVGEGNSVSSVEDEGRRASFLLLRHFDFAPQAWTNAPGLLPEGDHVLFLTEVPAPPPGYYEDVDDGDSAPEVPTDADEEEPEESESLDEEAGLTPPKRRSSSRRLRDPQHYLRFLEAGGTIVTALEEPMLEFLADDLGLADLHELTLSFGEDEDFDFDGHLRQRLIMPSGEEVSLLDWSRAWFEPPPLTSSFETVVTDDAGHPMVLSLTVGRGRLVLLPQDTFLDNDEIAEAENALYLVRLVEELRPAGKLLFDEYTLGGWTPENAAELAFARQNLGFSLHVIALVVLAVWASAWVREFPRDPEPMTQLASVERARAHAALLARSGRWEQLAHMLRRGVLLRVSGRSGTARELELTGEDGASPNLEAMSALCAPLEARLTDDAQRERLHHLFFEARPGNREELDRLGEELAQLEARLATAGQKTHQGTHEHG